MSDKKTLPTKKAGKNVVPRGKRYTVNGGPLFLTNEAEKDPVTIPPEECVIKPVEPGDYTIKAGELTITETKRVKEAKTKGIFEVPAGYIEIVDMTLAMGKLSQKGNNQETGVEKDI